MNKVVIILIVVVILGIGYYLISPLFIEIEVEDEAPSVNLENEESSVLYEGEFVESGGHTVAGSAKVIQDENGKKILRFENFETVNGPDLFIYLSTDTDASDFVNLGEIKGTKGNINYEIPDGTDLEKYDKVLVWCRAFRVLFSSADLG